MSKNTLIIALGIIPLVLIIILVVAVVLQPKLTEDKIEQVSPTPTLTSSSPNPEDTIRSFFYNLDANEYEKAIALLSSRMPAEESRSYLESFQNWDQVKINSINKAAPLDEVIEPTYLVSFELQLKEDAPEFIWQNGEQARFITLFLENGEYRIIEIATGP